MMNIQQSINTLKSRLARSSGLALVARWAMVIPPKVWLAAAALLFAGMWLQEHDAHVRARAELLQTRRQTAAQVSTLASEAEAAVRGANQRNAATVAALEAQRRNLATRADDLSGQLQSLQRQGLARAQNLAALPPAELARQLSTKLGPSSVVPGRPQPTADNGQMTLSAEGERKVASALSDLDSCLEQSAVEDRQAANCREQLAADAAEIQTQSDSLLKLNQALGDKDRILAARESEFRAELAAARGTWRSRAFRALKFMAVGVGVGVAIR